MVWEPQPGPQSSAITAAFVDELFFGGARGGGKSDYLLGDFLQDVNMGSVWRGVMFRKTYPELEELQIRAMEIYSPLGAVYKSTKSAEYPFSNCWYFPTGATLKMRYLESEKDADSYQGHQYTWIGFDELTNHATPYAYNKLKACLRSASGVHGRIRASGNPGGKGHLWVKQRFIDMAPSYHPYTDGDTGLTRMFIPSRVTDNKYLKDNEQYIALVKSSGSAELVRAWLEGDWDVIAGAYFTEFSRDRHVIKPFDIPMHWTRYRAFDWGSAKPFCCLWVAVSDGTIPKYPRGALIFFKEYYGMEKDKPNTGLKMAADEVAKEIVRRDRKMTTGDGGWGVADPAIFISNGGESIGEAMRRSHGLLWRPADNKRKPGWEQVRMRLKGDDDGLPMIYFFDTCVHTIRTLPAMQHDDHDPEDIDSDLEDHPPDTVRYACMARPYIRDVAKRKPPLEIGSRAWVYTASANEKTASKYRSA